MTSSIVDPSSLKHLGRARPATADADIAPSRHRFQPTLTVQIVASCTVAANHPPLHATHEATSAD